MSRGASPRSPPPSSLADEMPILDRSPPTRASSGLPSSLLRFVAHDSPASVKRALEGTRRSWEAVRTALGSRDAPPPPCLFASARSSPRCSTASCDASREEGDANSAHGHSGWFSEGFHSSRALANLLSARLDSVESDVAEAKRHLASLERWRRRVDASAEIASESGDSEDAAFASRAEDSSARTRSAQKSSSSSSREAFSEALASEPSASRLSLVALVAARTAAKRHENENENAHVSSPSDSDLANLATRHRARGARLLHPSPPESPEEARSSDEYDFERRDFERRVGTRGAASDESVDESVDESIDPLDLFDDRGSELSRLIEDVREVRAEVARLKNAPFFAGEDARPRSTLCRVNGSSPY